MNIQPKLNGLLRFLALGLAFICLPLAAFAQQGEAPPAAAEADTYTLEEAKEAIAAAMKAPVAERRALLDAVFARYAGDRAELVVWAIATYPATEVGVVVSAAMAGATPEVKAQVADVLARAAARDLQPPAPPTTVITPPDVTSVSPSAS